MKVYFVGAGPGDPDLLTVKARRLLESARCCIYAGSLVSPDIVAILPPGARRHDSAGMDLEQIIAEMVRARDEGIDVVRLHTGEPTIYGAIGEQMDALDALGIEYEVVPGISSFQAAAAALKSELTAPQVAQTVILTRTPGRTPVPAAEDLAQLARSGATLCVFLSSDRMEDVVAKVQPHYGGDCPAAAVYHASWPDQKVIRGTVGTIAALVRQAGITRTAIVLVGHALSRPLPHASRLYDRAFTHGYREAGET